LRRIKPKSLKRRNRNEGGSPTTLKKRVLAAYAATSSLDAGGSKELRKEGLGWVRDSVGVSGE